MKIPITFIANGTSVMLKARPTYEYASLVKSTILVKIWLKNATLWHWNAKKWHSGLTFLNLYKSTKICQKGYRQWQLLQNDTG